MDDLLPPFPVDSPTLAVLREAASRARREDGTYTSDISLDALLDFLSGASDDDPHTVADWTFDWAPDAEVVIYEDNPRYSINDAIRALIDEIERLRST